MIGILHQENIGFSVEAMAVTLLALPTEMIHLPGICWQSYETLLEKLVNRTLGIEWFERGDRFWGCERSYIGD